MKVKLKICPVYLRHVSTVKPRKVDEYFGDDAIGICNDKGILEKVILKYGKVGDEVELIITEWDERDTDKEFGPIEITTEKEELHKALQALFNERKQTQKRNEGKYSIYAEFTVDRNVPGKGTKIAMTTSIVEEMIKIEHGELIAELIFDGIEYKLKEVGLTLDNLI